MKHWFCIPGRAGKRPCGGLFLDDCPEHLFSQNDEELSFAVFFQIMKTAEALGIILIFFNCIALTFFYTFLAPWQFAFGFTPFC